LSIKERLELFLPICQAVQHAHQKGIIHRDLKPSNILICLYDGKPVPKVIDFGLAKAMYQSLTEQSLYTAQGMMLGTPLYMSPEQAEHNNLDIDTRSDVYSLGVILYELLTGSTPLEKAQFKQAAAAEMLRLIREVEPPKPSTRLSGSASLPSVAAQRNIDPAHLTRSITGDLDWVVMKALEKERNRRYETANGLAADIRRHLSDEPVSASPPSAKYRMQKFVKRNRAGVITASLVGVALILGVIGTSWGMLSAKVAAANEAEQREIAEKNEQKALQNEQIAHEANRQSKKLLSTNQDLFFEKAFAGSLTGGDTTKLFKDAIDAGVPEGRVNALEGCTLWFNGKSKSAAEKLEAVVEADPENIFAWTILYFAYHHLGSKKRFIALDKISELPLADDYDFLVAGYFNEISNNKSTSKEEPEALEESRKILKKNPTWISARIFFSHFLNVHAMVSDDPAFAEEAYEELRILKHFTGDDNTMPFFELNVISQVIAGKKHQESPPAEILKWEALAKKLAKDFADS
jgi:hypothetical protein